MTGSDADVISAIIGSLVLLGGVGGAIIHIYNKLTEHGTRITHGEDSNERTVQTLERVTLVVAQLEERTKSL